MGKRSPGFERKGRDFYATIDPAAVAPLVPHLGEYGHFTEPCAGAGDLAQMVEDQTQKKWRPWARTDISPQSPFVWPKDALSYVEGDVGRAKLFITNPPFSWPMLEPLLDHLPTLLPTWLLLPADVMHNKRMNPYVARCSKVVSVGRLYWMENKVKGVDNYAWFKFHNEPQTTVFYGRT